MESKHTKGEAKSDGLHIYVGGKRIGQTLLMSHNHDRRGKLIRDFEGDANAEFIAQAFNVSNETGMTPRELQNSRKELLEALIEASKIVKTDKVLYAIKKATS